MKKYIISILACSCLLLGACSDGSSLGNKNSDGDGKTTVEKLKPAVFAAFPTAEGHGRNTTGGRGGEVYYVTSLEDDNKEGSLRYAINQTGARTILFAVSGTIELKSELKIKNGDLTIAGQTAPGDGICLAGWPVSVDASNIIIRYLRFRMGDLKDINADGADAIGGRYQKDIIIDHCSMSWSTDECVSFYNNENFTMQWCIISESLRESKHAKGAHGYGGIWGGMKASFHHNLLANHDSRNPRLGPGVNSTKDNEIVDLRNNVIYNWSGNSCYGAEAMHVNIVNNYYKPGPATPSGTSKRGRIIAIDKKTSEADKKSYPNIFDTWGTFFIEGNVVNDGSDNKYCKNATENNWEFGVYNQFAAKYGTVDQETKDALKRKTPVATDEITTHTADEALNKVLSYAGCVLQRDAIDARIVDETRNGTVTFYGAKSGKPGIIDSQSDLGEAPWPILKSEDAPLDTDGDGIPDEWELKYGLDPKNKEDGSLKTLDPDSKYTNLERYINSLVEEFESGQK